jgi:hypothetical protein
MGNGLASERDFGHVAAGTLSAFADRVRHTARLANAYAHAPFAIANDDDGTEGEAAATLNHFRHALNIDDPFVEFLAFFFAGCARFTFAAWFIVAALGTISTGFIAAGSVAAGLVTALTVASTAATAA